MKSLTKTQATSILLLELDKGEHSVQSNGYIDISAVEDILGTQNDHLNLYLSTKSDSKEE